MARWIRIFPLHGAGRFVVLTNVSQEFSIQIGNGSEYTSRDAVRDARISSRARNAVSVEWRFAKDGSGTVAAC
jgi:hypothetical protein